MLANADMIRPIAEEAGIKIPSALDDWAIHEYPHWAVLVHFSIGRPVEWHNVWDRIRHNAKVIADLSSEEILGLSIGEIGERLAPLR